MTDSCPLAPYTEACQLEEAEGAACGDDARAAAVGVGTGAGLAAAGQACGWCSMEEEGAAAQHGRYLRCALKTRESGS